MGLTTFLTSLPLLGSSRLTTLLTSLPLLRSSRHVALVVRCVALVAKDSFATCVAFVAKDPFATCRRGVPVGQNSALIASGLVHRVQIRKGKCLAATPRLHVAKESLATKATHVPKESLAT